MTLLKVFKNDSSVDSFENANNHGTHLLQQQFMMLALIRATCLYNTSRGLINPLPAMLPSDICSSFVKWRTSSYSRLTYVRQLSNGGHLAIVVRHMLVNCQIEGNNTFTNCSFTNTNKLMMNRKKMKMNNEEYYLI